MIGLGLLSAFFAIFGKRISRILLVANGVLVALLWWLAVGIGMCPCGVKLTHDRFVPIGPDP